MKGIGRLAAVALLSTMVGCDAAEKFDGAKLPELDLSRVTIVGPAERKGSNAFAVEELKTHLRKVCNSIFCDQAPVKFVFAKPADGRTPETCESIYRIDGNTIWFWGEDSGPTMDWQIGDRQFQEMRIHNGSLFAVELFAEKELGVKWLWPGDDGYVCTPHSRVALPKFKEASYVSKLAKAELRKGKSEPRDRYPYEECAKYVPDLPKEILSLDNVGVREYFRESSFWRWRHRLQDRESISYGHAFTDWKRRFLKTHPEYLALVDGERGNVRGQEDRFVHLCVTCEGTVDQIVRDWVKRGKNKYLNACENDCGVYCQCADCTKFDVQLPSEKKKNHYSDRYAQFWDRIAEKARKIRPDVLVTGYMYAEYRLPPRKYVMKNGENILLGAVPSMMDDTTALFNGWRKMGARRFFLRPNHHCYYGTIPRGMERYLYRNMREAIDCGAIGFDYDAQSCRPGMEIEYYITAKMLQDPDFDFEQACTEFYSGYGAAAEEVRQYYEAVRRDGERARNEFLSKGEKLDNSQIAMAGPRALQAYGRNEAELKEKVAILKRALADHRDLDLQAKQRLEHLILIAEQAVHTYRFCAAAANYKTDQDTFWVRSRELLDFRKAHYRDLRDDYSAVFRCWWGEVQQWKFLRRPKNGAQPKASNATWDNSL